MTRSLRLLPALAALTCLVATSAQASPATSDAPAPELFAEFLRTDDLDLAAGAARRLEFDGMEPQVRRMTNGDFAVVAGPKPIADERSETIRLIEDRSPAPIRYAPPAAYGPPVVWRRLAAPLARAEYRRGEKARVAHGGLRVEVVYRKGPGGRPAPVMIGRIGGRVVFSTPPRADAERAPFGMLRLIRLDPAAPRPAAVLTAYTGGLHCCTATTIASLQADGRWRVAQGRLLDGEGYQFEDVDGDGTIELTSLDNSFLYAFTSYAGSFSPPRVSRVVGAELVDVTRLPSSRGFLRQSVQAMAFGRTPEQWRENGFLAGWVAARALLGEGAQAWAAMEPLHEEFSLFTQEICPDGSQDGCADENKRRVPFKEALARHLAENGYDVGAADITPRARPRLPAPPELENCAARAASLAADRAPGVAFAPALFSCAP